MILNLGSCSPSEALTEIKQPRGDVQPVEGAVCYLCAGQRREVCVCVGVEMVFKVGHTDRFLPLSWCNLQQCETFQ